MKVLDLRDNSGIDFLTRELLEGFLVLVDDFLVADFGELWESLDTSRVVYFLDVPLRSDEYLELVWVPEVTGDGDFAAEVMKILHPIIDKFLIHISLQDVQNYYDSLLGGERRNETAWPLWE